MAAGQESLKAAMREALDANGTMSHIKAELRAAVFQSLTGGTPGGSGDNDDAAGGGGSSADAMAAQHPPAPPENMIINELIKQYLSFNGLEHTLAVFQLEARVPDAPVPHNVLATELNLTGAPASLPLLYALLHEARLSRDMQ